MKEEASAAQASGKRGGNGAGLKVATIVASVVAVCGISFGVYGMVQSAQKEKQLSNLKVQIKKDDGTTTTVETPKIETKTDDGTTITITDTPAEKVDPKKYIYISNWGVKIKLPEDNRGAFGSYKFYNNWPQAVNSFEILERDGNDDTKAVFMAVDTECSDDEWGTCTEIKVKDSSIRLLLWLSKSSKASKEFKDWVTNPDNYSEI